MIKFAGNATLKTPGIKAFLGGKYINKIVKKTKIEAF
jgi:hypothetical protein